MWGEKEEVSTECVQEKMEEEQLRSTIIPGF